MDFRTLNIKTVILVIVAGLLLVITIFAKITSRPVISQESVPSPATLVPKTITPVMDTHQRIIADPKEDSLSMKEMKEQMDSDRLQQKKIKMLKLQLEQTNLQLEQEKARSEINKLEKENTSIVNDSNDQGQDKYPEVKVIYIGGSEKSKQAILAINGNNYSVKEKNKPVKNVEVVSINDTSVTLHFNLPQDLTTAIDYKPE